MREALERAQILTLQEQGDVKVSTGVQKPDKRAVVGSDYLKKGPLKINAKKNNNFALAAQSAAPEARRASATVYPQAVIPASTIRENLQGVLGTSQGTTRQRKRQPVNGRPPTRNTKSLTALGEIPVEMLSDMGSTPITSTTTRPGIRKVFRAVVLLENKAFQG